MGAGSASITNVNCTSNITIAQSASKYLLLCWVTKSPLRATHGPKGGADLRFSGSAEAAGPQTCLSHGVPVYRPSYQLRGDRGTCAWAAWPGLYAGQRDGWEFDPWPADCNLNHNATEPHDLLPYICISITSTPVSFPTAECVWIILLDNTQAYARMGEGPPRFKAKNRTLG